MNIKRAGTSNPFSLLHIFGILAIAILLQGGSCDGDDGNDGNNGAAGLNCWDLNENGIKDLPDEDLNNDGVVNTLDCNGLIGGSGAGNIGDGSALTQEQVDAIGQLVATIDNVEIASPPVVDFTVTDIHGNPALGISGSVTWFTIAKLMPGGDPNINGGLSYWQSYINQVEETDGELPDALASAIQATTDAFRGGTLEELGGGKYRYTFGTDVTNVTEPVAVPWCPGCTTRVGLEIRLSDNEEDGVEVEVPLAPNNPVFDFVPDGGAGTGTRDISDTEQCSSCHNEFAEHGGPRKTVEYCVTCHNQGTTDQDTGNTVDFAHLAHSIHPGGGRAVGEDRESIPYIIYGFGESEHDYSEVTYPQSLTYCENCHNGEEEPDGNNWNEFASVKPCSGCHADGLQTALGADNATQVPLYGGFDHANADANIGLVTDGTCGNCHLGDIEVAGPARLVHRRIDGDDRFREELGQNYVLSVVSATNTGPGQTPVINFRVDKPDGTAWDIINDPEFDTANNASLNLYVAWVTDDIYNGDNNGNAMLGRRDECEDGITIQPPGEPHRMELCALQRDAVQNPDGSYTVTYFAAIPADIATTNSDVRFALGGHPAAFARNADAEPSVQRAAPKSAVSASTREPAVTSKQCNNCHQFIQEHGSNRNGNIQMCLICHTADLAVTDDPLPQAGFSFTRMIHGIHTASEDYLGGEFAEVTYPQSAANCVTCHKEDAYQTAREGARAVSTGPGGDDDSWLNDTATTPSAQACGNCHTGTAAAGHFASNGGQVDVAKDTVIGATPGVGGVPNGQEACAVCHSAGSEFDTTLYHNPTIR